MNTAKGQPRQRMYSARQGAEHMRAGIDTARRAVELASSVLEEVTAGMNEVTRRSVRVAAASVGGVQRAAAASTQPPASPPTGQPATAPADASTTQCSTTTHPNGADLADQMLDLARQMMRLATDTAGRVLDVVAGPVERLVDPDPAHEHETWLALGTHSRNAIASGRFDVVDDTGNGATIGLTLTNPLASMGGTIPISAVSFHLADPTSTTADATRELPWSVAVPPKGSVKVEIDVAVPPDQAPGTYLGIVRSPEVPEFHLVVELEVI